MIILTGKNLGERHKDLNMKVHEATIKRVDFDEIKQTPEESDVDKLFKIAVASKYMNIEYIIDVLKCGDPLYISKALKCDWIYGDNYAHIINPRNLQNDIIPYMSIKMKKKMLTAISMHIRNESRAVEFYNYCVEIGCTNIAIKFLHFTTENFKLEILKDPLKFDRLRPFVTSDEGAVIKHFIGSSFTLADTFLKVNNCNRNDVLRELIYLYALSEEKYLDLLEKYTNYSIYNKRFLSIHISKSIMKKHKHRVIKNPILYVSVLNKTAIVKYSTEEDAKIYALAFFPIHVDDFWYSYLSEQKYYLDKITTGRFQFIKQMFTSKFPKEEFENSLKFYDHRCYEIMTVEEKETWALQQIASEKEILGKGQDYLWYKFVNFEKAFKEMKRLVMITPNRSKRADMILILIESAKTQRDLETLLKYFYERHINEQKHVKENFLDKVLRYFNVYEFDKDCWEALNIMFHNLEVYSSTDYISKNEYRLIAVIYHIINDIEIPQVLKEHIANGMQIYSLKTNTDTLTKEKIEKVFQYLFDLIMEKIREFEIESTLPNEIRKHIYNLLDLLDLYEKPKELIPELVNHFMKLDWSEYEYHRFIRTDQSRPPPLNLLRDLKSDSKHLIENLPRLRKELDTYDKCNISTALKKLRIYFTQDVAKECLRYFNTLLDEEKLWHKEAQAIVHALFQLGDLNFKVDLMKKFAPSEATINHSEIDEKLLRIQMAICSHILYSRPPIPLECTFMYLKGDYVPFCLPIFNALLSNLPVPLCMDFVENLLNKPVSIQKHGIRLAFECFNTENFNTVILSAWNKTKNVSLRLVIFDALYSKISSLPSGQEALFETLKSIILRLQPDDDDEIFNIIKSNKLPEHLVVETIEMAWKVVSQFPPKLTNLIRMQDLIICITNRIHQIRQDIVSEIVDTFVASVFKPHEVETKDKLSYEAISLIDSKWQLTVNFLTYVDENNLDKKIEVTKLILMKSFKPQNYGSIKNRHDLIDIGISFISQLEDASYNQAPTRYVTINKLMQSVIETLQTVFATEEIYILIWKLQLGIVARKTIIKPVNEIAANIFARELGNLVKEFIDKELFFNSFLSQINYVLQDKIQHVISKLYLKNTSDFYLKIQQIQLRIEMIILTGKNLGERHKDLNSKVHEATTKRVDFDEIKQKPEESDADKLFKIAVASKYMNIEYIIDVLKCGDPLYISKALKCEWIYGDNYAHIINPRNLQNDIIPCMSIKMKKKMLTAISMHIRNESRAVEFYNYCVEIGCTNIAIKFLHFTTENFKLEILKDPLKFDRLRPHITSDKGAVIKHFIGLSFTLADLFLEVFICNRNEVLRELIYLYAVSEEKYLDLLEKFTDFSNCRMERFLSIRISTSIMKKHKDRVIKNPILYVSVLNKKAIVKYSTEEDAKIYALEFFPQRVDDFWYSYLSEQKYYLDKITTGRFQFIKQMFTSKFPEEEFENSLKFYDHGCYEIMTSEEKETWALQQLAGEKEILGKGQDYLWYKFVNFEKAFKEMKRLVMITPNRSKRADMILILIESAKTQRDLETLLKYFYERHINEQKHVKENFLDKVLRYFNVYEFDKDCWEALNIMFHNLEVYSSTDYISKNEYRLIAVIYHIVNDIEIPQVLKEHIASDNMQFYSLKDNTDTLTKEQTDKVFQYIFNLFMDKIREHKNKCNAPYVVQTYIKHILDLLYVYKKPKELIPELVNHFMKLDWSEYENHKFIRSEERRPPPLNLLSDLKSDSQLLIDNLPLLKSEIYTSDKCNISKVLKKLRIYFTQDVAKECLRYFNTLLDEEKLWHKEAQAIVHALFQLGDLNFKVDLMKKFAPSEATINHSEIDEKLLRIQMAICSHILYSRPPIPLECTFMYLKGDYVPFCLPIFNALLSNLPVPLCMDFVENLLNKPVSIQKHGIRLAFECFNTENFNTVILSAWNKTKNVSLRLVIFDALYSKISSLPSGQEALFETLKSIILRLQPDDDDEIFNIIKSNKLPEHLVVETIEMAWKVVSQFPPKLTNLIRMQDLIICITNRIHQIRQDIVSEIVDTFVALVFKPHEEETKDKLSYEAISLIDSKWQLTASFLTYVDENNLDKKIEVTKLILMKSFKPQNYGSIKNRHDLIDIGISFISQLEDASYNQAPTRYVTINKLMQSVIETLQTVFATEEIYILIWKLQLGIVARKTIIKPVNEIAANIFARELGNLVKEFIDKDLFFNSFLSQINYVLQDKIQHVISKLYLKNTSDFYLKIQHRIEMIILTGKNLGERHKDLNSKVHEATTKRVDFDEIKQKPEESDADKLFKIAVASKYMNIEYIIDVLKCGDPLYISKALRCEWIYGDNYAHIINPRNLQNDIIPCMSIKMKKKMLTSISMHIRTESRAVEFYNYCVEIGCTNIAIKFLHFTTENFKLQILKDPLKFDRLRPLITSDKGAVIKHFIGLSFTLADLFLEVFICNRNEVPRELIYLYAVSEEKYLDLLEKFTDFSNCRMERFLSIRISTSIMKKHKHRVIKNPILYVSVLNKKAIVKYSTEEDAKMYALAFFPKHVDDFWCSYLSEQKYYLDKITTGKFQFIKQMFTSKFPEEEFENSSKFYVEGCYEIMTSEEKETWALQQLASEKEILGDGEDYLWYKFINFEKAFKEMKRMVLIIPDRSTRANMMFVLVESAKTQRDLETLLKYFYEKYINEQKHVKEHLIDSVLRNFNVFEFDKDCWEALNIMFHNIEVYSSTDYSTSWTDYKGIAIIYHLINDIEIPQVVTDTLTKEQTDKVFQYIFNLFMDKISEHKNKCNAPYVVQTYIKHILELLYVYKKPKELIPELVNHFMKLDWSEYENHKFIRSEESRPPPLNLLRDLKSDSQLLIDNLPLLKSEIYTSDKCNISKVLKKLRIYFKQDVAKEYLRYFNALLDEEKLWHKEAQAIVHALFQLGDLNFKVDLMKKFAPSEATIDHSEIDEKLLHIQMAICSHILYSRPPIPLECTLMYIKGDYVPFCLPIFDALLSNLPLPLCIHFVENLLNKPVSIQKHGIRLVIGCLNVDKFNTVILSAWNKTKNVSLRVAIFDALYSKISTLPSGQEALFETLKSIILRLRPDDDDKIFNIINSNKLPEHLVVESIETAWKVVSQFPPKLSNLNRMRDLINCITNRIHQIRQDIVSEIVDTFVALVFKPYEVETKDKLSYEAISLIHSKWQLTVNFLTYVDENNLDKKIEVTKLILMKCFKPQKYGSVENKHDLIDIGTSFISQLEDASYNQAPSRYVTINKLMQSVIETLQTVFAMKEIYILIWKLQLGIVARKTIIKPVNEIAANIFARELGNLVKEFIDKELFFNSFLTRINDVLQDKIQHVISKLNLENTSDFCVKIHHSIEMIILKGKNLGERHKDLNSKVHEATAKRVDFDEIKQTPEESDVDKLFKIAVASKYMNIEYIIDVLKCGDPLYISKALKCEWIYGDNYAHIINPRNLQNDIIPYMSIKMKKKVLTAISMHIRNESRAVEFYNYCVEIGCTNIAIKFLHFTTENFKLEILKDPLKIVHLRYLFTSDKGVFIKHFIGSSFILANAFLKVCGNRSQGLRKLVYLYTFSEEEYLKLLEKHTMLNNRTRESETVDRFLSLRISKSIMKKHKDRVIKKPTLYINILSKQALTKYSTEEDAKFYAIALLPDDVHHFWTKDPFCIKQRFLFDIIISTSKYKFVKEIFTSKYPDEEFETDLSFYSQVCDLMTAEEKEIWANEEIARQKKDYGEVLQYKLYRFTTFEKAFGDIKELLLTSKKAQRTELLLLLIEFAKDQRHLDKVLKLFCQKHINIEKRIKETFIEKVMEYFNVYELDTNCWESLNQIFRSFNVYDSIEFIDKYEYRTIALIRHIINDIELPAALRTHIDNELYFISFENNTKRLTKEQQEKVFQYFFNLYMGEIRKFENVPYDNEVKVEIRSYIHNVLRLLELYNRTNKDCPELVNHFIKLDWPQFKRLRFLRTESGTEAVHFVEPRSLMCDLKSDSKLLIECLPFIRKNINVPYKFKITAILKKLKIYFSHDIAQEYLRFFVSLLNEDKLWHKEAQAGVHALLLLGDEDFKVDLMKKYAPTEATINHKEIDEKLLRIQRAIYSHILYSRPPVPLEYTFMYLKGDYVHFCLPMFNALLSNLPFLQLRNFVETLLNTPVSTQKHGIRLAFQCLNTEDLNAIILRTWNKMKNVSLRIVIFGALYNKITELPNGQDTLFPTLKSMILTLNHDDDDEIFNLIKSNKLPEHLTVECIEIAWKVSSSFPLTRTNIDRMHDLINYMIDNIDKIGQSTVREIINTFIESGFNLHKEEAKENLSSEAISFIESKWLLTLKYLMTDDGLEEKIEVTKLILMKCFKPEDIKNKQVLIDTGMRFISQLEDAPYSIMQSVIETLETVFAMEEIYILIWKLQLGIVARKAINKPNEAFAYYVINTT
ncbi:hypothetical protein HF086_005336 [Spodoptera exigua]|uniref:Uncharacterized protein n=1 Tax=Spodoptera exigua TaxID=7107 RepID=A0A922MZC5_SPOEX|nr:hypothetical protein HF086_005336 [Spodoptera exigua]